MDFMKGVHKRNKSILCDMIMKLIVENVKKKFDKKEVLKGINFTFKKGKIYGLLGRNGAGKTTFFNCLNEDINVDEGNFIIEEEKSEKENDSQEKVQRKLEISDIGYVVRCSCCRRNERNAKRYKERPHYNFFNLNSYGE